MLGVEGKRALEAEDGVGDADREAGEDDQGAGVALPGLLAVGTGTEQAVDGPLNEGQEVDAPLEDADHVGTQIAPREPERDDEGDDDPEVAHLDQNHSGLNMAMPR